jgi:hypothetical protein
MNSSDELLNFVSSVSGDTFLKVEETFGDGYVRLKVSEAERRQAKHDIRSLRTSSLSCCATRATPTLVDLRRHWPRA